MKPVNKLQTCDSLDVRKGEKEQHSSLGDDPVSTAPLSKHNF